MPAVHQRSESSDLSSTFTTIHSPIVIAGITIIILIICGLFSWLAFRICQKRAAAKRESKMGAAFLSVKGVVPDGPGNEKSAPPSVYIFHCVQNDINHIILCFSKVDQRVFETYDRFYRHSTAESPFKFSCSPGNTP